MLYRFDRDKLNTVTKLPVYRPAEFGLLEKDIETLFSTHLHDLIAEDQLMLIGQERQFQEEADLLAVDRKGTLYIFEIKRWSSNKENLLQVLRYGQKFGRYTYEEIEDLAVRQQKLEGKLSEKHKEYFDLGQPLDESKFNDEQVFVVVTNGVDRDTLEAIRYWANKGIRIDSLTYKLYRINDEPYIYFDVYNPEHDVIMEENPGIFIVNTNVTYMEHAWRDMLDQSKAAAYYDRKHAIANITKGSTVYLYHTGSGVIAKGKSTDSYKKTDCDTEPDEQYYVPLQFEWKIDGEHLEAAVAAWEINKKLKSGYRFRKTVFAIPPEMGKTIDLIWKRRRK